MLKIYTEALKRNNLKRPPVWFMRQAGRYHKHYQKLKHQYSFEKLCKNPSLACQVTLGPIEDFGFDAAILFSDILFLLECLNFKVTFSPGPKLSWHLDHPRKIKDLTLVADAKEHLYFQKQALDLIRQKLSDQKGLIGFVGSPLTLFYFAACGSHRDGNLDNARTGLTDNRFDEFCNLLVPLLLDNMLLQAQAKIDSICIFDSCAGDIPWDLYRLKVLPILKFLFINFKTQRPDVSITYYGNGATFQHWQLLAHLPIDCLAIDQTQDIITTLKVFSNHFAIQGNIDPEWLTLDNPLFEKHLRQYFNKIIALPSALRQGWICGLGHGVLPQTRTENIRSFFKIYQEYFGYE